MKRLTQSRLNKPINRVVAALSSAVLLAVPLMAVRMQSAHAAVTPTFVQQSSTSPQSPQSTVNLSLPSAETAGDTNVLVVSFFNATGNVGTVSDNRGNTYQVAVPLYRDAIESQAIYYAKNITGGSTTATVTFNGAVPYPDIRLVEYKNLDKNAPFVAGNSGGTTAKTIDSGAAVTTSAGLVFGAGTTGISYASAGTGFTKRMITADDNIVEDKTVTTGGSYNATANQSKSGKAMMQVAIFKAAPDPSSDTTPPSVPASLMGSPVSTSQINVSWSASTDAVGVTGYKVFRGGVQVATTTATSYSDTGLSVNTSYSYTVSAFDAAGNNSAQSAPVAAATLPDTTAPTVPGGLTATPVSASQVNLSWSASSDQIGVAGYRVYAGGVLAGSVAGNTYQSTGLQPGATYSYSVSAYDAAGNESSQSAVVAAATPAPDTMPPTVPAGLTAAAVSTSQVNLSWSASTDDTATTGYSVYRDGTQVATVSGTTYQDTGLSAATTYNYTVSAYDASGNASVQSAPVAGTTLAPDTTAPSVPGSLTVVPISTAEIDLSWAPATDDIAVTGYTVYQNFVPVANVTSTTYSSMGLAPGTAYTYTVAAYDAAGNVSAQSDPATATTLPQPVNSCALPNYPNASCTGVPAGTTLTTVNGDVTVNIAGTVIDSQDIHGCVLVNVPGVVIKNSRIDCAKFITVMTNGAAESGTPLLIEDSEVDCMVNGIPGQGTAISERNFTALRNNIHGCENGFDLDGNGDIEDNYIHDLYQSAVAHTDGLQSSDGSNSIIKHNTFYANDGTSAININNNSKGPHTTNVTVSNNLLAGGAYTLYCPIVSDVSFQVLNNHFSNIFAPNIGEYGPTSDCGDTEITSGNVYQESGLPVLMD